MCCFYDVVILLQLAVSLFLPVYLCDVRKMLCSAVKANVFIGHCVAELPWLLTHECFESEMLLCCTTSSWICVTTYSWICLTTAHESVSLFTVYSWNLSYLLFPHKSVILPSLKSIVLPFPHKYLWLSPVYQYADIGRLGELLLRMIAANSLHLLA